MTSTDDSVVYVSVNITLSNFEQPQQDCLFYKSAKQYLSKTKPCATSVQVTALN